MSKRPVVVVDAGSYSLSETAITGAAQRLVEITQVLSQRFSVQVIAHAHEDLVDLGDAEIVTPEDSCEATIGAARAVIFFDTPVRDRVEIAVARRRLIVAECRAPLEHMQFPSLLAQSDPTGEHQRYLDAYRRLLHVGHHYLCRSQAERLGMISALCVCGRIRPADLLRSASLDHFLTTVPVGFSARSLKAAEVAEPRRMADFLWTGGMWAFFRPMMLVEAMRLLRDRGVHATAAFMYAQPLPDTQRTITDVKCAVAEYGLGDRVLLNTRSLPLSQRDQYLKAARAYVCITNPGVENETATRLRLRDTLLHGVPTVIDPFGNSADIVARQRLGIVLHDCSAAGLADALERVNLGTAEPPGHRANHLYESTLTPFMDWLAREFRDN